MSTGPDWARRRPAQADHSVQMGTGEWVTTVSPSHRFGAWLIDSAVSGLLAAVVGTFVGTVTAFALLAESRTSGEASESLMRAEIVWLVLVICASVLGPLAYHFVGVAVWGKTLGRLATLSQIVRVSDGSPPGTAIALARTLLLGVLFVPVIGWLLALGSLIAWIMSDDGRGLVDRVSRSAVIRWHR